MTDRSTPSFFEFNPAVIPFQKRLVYDLDYNIDWSLGTHEFLLSGSIGSAKSLLAAHLIIRHALEFKGAKILIGRRALPDLKDTLFQKIIEHLESDQLVENKHYWINHSQAYIELANGSIILGKSWADKKYRKFRSLELSMAVIEEAIESDGDDYQALVEIRQRLQRQPHIKKNMILYLTNPAGPSHPLYNYFIVEQSKTRHVYYSLTRDNPFLPKTYVEQLRKDLPPKEAARMLDGQWIEIDRERVYYSYKSEFNFKKQDYIIQPHSPIRICYDFNIGYGKPMSVALGQYILAKDEWHFFDEVVIEGTRTEDTLEEMASRGIFEMPHEFIIHGDATGAARSAASKYSNYEVIKQFLDNYKTKSGLKLNYKVLVPRSNPPIRERHIIVNGYCENSLGHRRLFVYQKAKTVDEGLRLTALKKGADYLEDDSKSYQHITTALGYGVVYVSKNKVIVKGGNIG